MLPMYLEQEEDERLQAAMVGLPGGTGKASTREGRSSHLTPSLSHTLSISTPSIN